eukprot:jgi/Chlat1/4395/Chrsp29S04530
MSADDDELALALVASLLDSEVHSEAALRDSDEERAQLEQAIALSLALDEEQRTQLQELRLQELQALQASIASDISNSPSAPPMTPSTLAASQPVESRNMQQSDKENAPPIALTQATNTTKPMTRPNSAAILAKHMANLGITAKQPQQRTLPAPVLVPVRDPVGKSTQPQPTPAHLKPTSPKSAAATLPAIDAHALRAAAEAAARTQRSLAATTAMSTTPPTTTITTSQQQPTKQGEDLAARKEHLEQLRDMLLAKKQGKMAVTPAAKVSSGDAQKACDQPAVAAPPTSAKPLTPADEERARLRSELVQQLKEGLQMYRATVKK